MTGFGPATARLGLAGIATAAVVLGIVVAVVNVRGMAGSAVGSAEGPPPFVDLYEPPTSSLERVLNQGDGQAFAALALDPALQRPEVFRGAPQAAYRAQRPVLGWLAWATSLGRPGLVPLALVAWSVVGFALLGVTSGSLLAHRGVTPIWGLAVILTPGALTTLDWTGPEALGAALALAGVGWWARGRLGPAVAALVVAGLCRETMLLVPVVLALHEWHRSVPLRRVAWLAAPAATWAAWVVVVHWRLDAWPTDGVSGQIGTPLAGVIDAASGWGPADAIVALLLVAAVAAAVALARGDVTAWLALAYLAVSACFGEKVWTRLEDFSRVLLPMLAFSLIALIPAVVARRSALGPSDHDVARRGPGHVEPIGP